MGAFARFPARLQQAIVSRKGWSSLRPVQDLAGEAILDGKNCVVLAPTAGGKTEASIFPVLAGLLSSPPESVGALYIAPIKALLNNQEDRLGLYMEMVGLDRFLWHGDIPQNERTKFLREPTELLMTTPESLEVMLVSTKIATAKLFADLRYVIIDEVHAMAGADRGAHLMSVLERLARFTPHDVQRIGLSATVGNPNAILEWLRGSSKREGVVIDPPKEKRGREIGVHLDGTIDELASRAADRARGKKSLFFCQSRAMSEAVADRMRDRGTDVFVHHSSVSLSERQLAEEKFARGQNTAIVCTSTLELGIDVGGLDSVFQANAPSTVSSFLQRMGRTGRREGTTANTTFFCDDPESVLFAAAIVELAREGWVEAVPPQTRCWPALVHQLFAMTLQFGGIGRERAWEQLSRVPDFRGIEPSEFDEMLAYMLRRGFLFESGGLLSLGEKAERVYGRRNFMELYAVFSTPQYYRVLTAAGKEIGALEQNFVDELVAEMTSFLLGGRAWLVSAISHQDRTVSVTPAPRGKKPSWGGFAPKLIGYEICQRIRRLLEADDELPYLSDDAAAALAGYREDFREMLRRTGHAIQLDEHAARWWTFAGGRINQTLRYALAQVGGWKVVADNFHLRIEGDGVTHNTVAAAIATIEADAFWNDLAIWERIIAALPPYRLSKFQPALPPRFQQEMIGRYLLDLDGTRAFLTGRPGTEGAARLLRAALTRAVAAPELEEAPSPGAAQPTLPIRFIATRDELAALVDDLAREPIIALDVETTLVDRDVCTVQIGTPAYSAIVDALAVGSLEALAPILERSDIVKVIHNASFERSTLRRLSLSIVNVFDTLPTSRRLRGRNAEGGHSLAAVCRRELGLVLDKSEQTSDWTRRPLTQRQLAYAALDVEVLGALHARFRSEMLV
jgi:ATP-dependent Lhr-like helicase